MVHRHSDMAQSRPVELLYPRVRPPQEAKSLGVFTQMQALDYLGKAGTRYKE